jgi:iron complex transport system substrate-binding protein
VIALLRTIVAAEKPTTNATTTPTTKATKGPGGFTPVAAFLVSLGAACLMTPMPSSSAETRGANAPAANTPSIAVIDDSGVTVTLDRPARRIVTLAPSLTEFVYAVGAGDAMVGTVDSSDFPAAARSVPRIGDYQRLDIERIASLKPDLVLVWQHGNSGREVAQLEALGLRLFRLEPRRLGEVAVAIEKVGRLTGFDAEGHRQADALRSDLSALRSTHATQASVRVFYQAWSRPLMTLGGGQLTNDVIELCGGQNVFAGIAMPAPQISTEAVVAARPEAIVSTRGSHSTGGLKVLRAPNDPVFSAWSAFASMPAVSRQWMFLLSADELVRAGPRIGEGVRSMCEALDVVRSERR